MTGEPRKIRMIMALRKAGVTDTKVLAAMERTPRELFVPPTFRDKAYDDVDGFIMDIKARHCPRPHPESAGK